MINCENDLGAVERAVFDWMTSPPPPRPRSRLLGQPRAGLRRDGGRGLAAPGAGGRGDRRVLASTPAGSTSPTGRDNLLVRAFESLHPADGIAFRLRSEIPLARGLGSSAAAIVAGLFAADHLFELALSKEEMLARATEMEGHPDNVAAAIYGGFVDLRRRGERGARARPASTRPSGLEGIVVIPAEEVSTERAREAIPAEVPLADAVANVSAASRLVLGLQQRRPRPGRPRPRRPHPPAAPPRALPALDGDRRRGRRAGRARGDDLRRRPDRPRLDHLAGRRQGRRGARASAVAGWAEVRRLPFTPARRRRPRALSVDWVVQIGLVELALGGLLGWAMVVRAGEARSC